MVDPRLVLVVAPERGRWLRELARHDRCVGYEGVERLRELGLALAPGRPPDDGAAGARAPSGR